MFLHFIRSILSDYFNNIGPKIRVYIDYKPNLAGSVPLGKTG